MRADAASDRAAASHTYQHADRIPVKTEQLALSKKSAKCQNMPEWHVTASQAVKGRVHLQPPELLFLVCGAGNVVCLGLLQLLMGKATPVRLRARAQARLLPRGEVAAEPAAHLPTQNRKLPAIITRSQLPRLFGPRILRTQPTPSDSPC